jgi:hypothetical protein
MKFIQIPSVTQNPTRLATPPTRRRRAAPPHPAARPPPPHPASPLSLPLHIRRAGAGCRASLPLQIRRAGGSDLELEAATAALLVAGGGIACGRRVDAESGRPLPCGLIPMARGDLHLRRRSIRRFSWTHGEIWRSSWIRRCSLIRWCSLTHGASGGTRGSGVSHPILQGKPNASHMCTRIIYTHMIDKTRVIPLL